MKEREMLVERMTAIEQLERTYSKCKKCDLSKGRKNLVHWRGSPTAPLCLIGEAPGEKEDKKGLPFVGDAGRRLDLLLIKADLNPAEDVFVVNLVACRPPRNRVPTVEECRACRPRLERLVDINQPRALLLFGSTAALRLAGITAITTWRGHQTNVEMLFEDVGVKTYKAIPTYHPSYLNRTGNNPKIQKQMIADIKKGAELAGYGQA